MKRTLWLPVVATVAAVAVGIGAFAVAAPFAAPRSVDVEAVDAWVLPISSGLTPLAFEANQPQAPIDELLASTSLPASDPASPESISAVIDSVVAVRTALDTVVPDSLVVPRSRFSAADLSRVGSDPCALLASPTPETCPEGARATVLGGDLSQPLVMRLTNQVRCVEGERQRSDYEFRAYTNRPVSITVQYPATSGPRTVTVETSDDAREEWLEAGAQDFVWQCIALTDLPPNWNDSVRIIATDDRGETVELERRLNWVDFDVRSAPPSWVETRGQRNVVISIPAREVSTVRFLAFAVPFGENPPGCNFDDADGAIAPLGTVIERFSREQLQGWDYNDWFVKRHTASFVVPEASTISVCAGWVNRGSWEGNIPDNVYGQVLHSPDLAYPVVSVADADFDEWIGANPVQLTASSGATGFPCGSWSTDLALGDELCDLTSFAEQPAPTWSDSLVVSTRQENTPAGAERLYTFAVPPQPCGPGCNDLEPYYLDLPLPAQNECLGNGCPDVERGWVRLKVDWVDGQDSWFSDWGREDAPPGGPNAPVLDRSVGIAVGAPSPDGLTRAANAVIATDRDVTVRAVLTYEFSLSSEAGTLRFTPDLVVVNDEFSSRHTIDLGQLDVMTAYSLAVTLTDREGVTSRYSGDGENGLTWPASLVYVDPEPLEVRTTVTASRLDGGPVVVGETEVTVGQTRFAPPSSRSTWFSCSTGDVAVISESYRQAELGRIVPVRIRSEAFAPSALGARDTECPSDLPRPRGGVPTIDQVVQVPLSQLITGTTITLELEQIVVNVRVKVEPRP